MSVLWATWQGASYRTYTPRSRSRNKSRKSSRNKSRNMKCNIALYLATVTQASIARCCAALRQQSCRLGTTSLTTITKIDFG